MSKLEIVNINNKVVSVDIAELIKKENIYFNATEIAKQFDKMSKDYLDNKNTQSYIQARCQKDNCPLESYVKVKHGGTGRGTWLHHKLAIDFARWCSPEFAIELDDWIMQKLQEEKQRKVDRAIARLEYPDLTDAIQEFLSTGKDSDKWLYSNEADMINATVLGCKAKKYCELNNIDRTCLRDNLTSGQINLIKQLQRFDTALVQAGIEYGIRKEKVSIYYAKLVAKLLN